MRLVPPGPEIATVTSTGPSERRTFASICWVAPYDTSNLAGWMSWVALIWYCVGSLSKFFGRSSSPAECAMFSAIGRFLWKTASTFSSSSGNANWLQPAGPPPVAQVSSSGVQPITP